MVCISRLLVGSSRKSRCGLRIDSSANATRAFWPPERVWMGDTCVWPGRPNFPNIARTRSTPKSGCLGNFLRRKSTGFWSRSNISAKC
mmetsp:Transcript_22429/g.35227  ORF Transcript_22429/g.35227 Transcript_22429/m.35227 type:complete len:88 (+) Transcript_22429:287-550(+)